MMETVVWVGLGLGLPWLGRGLRARLLDPQGEGARDVEWLARAAYGVLLPFGAWASGALVGRELGWWPPWRGSALWSLAAVAGAVLVGEWVLRRGAARSAFRRAIGEDRSLADLFDTPRWSLYRAAGLLWTGNPLLAALAGWFLALLEDIGRAGGVPNPARGADRGRLIWTTASMVVLGLGGNLWVTLVAQAGCLWLARADRG
jgi:hypothetical protein